MRSTRHLTHHPKALAATAAAVGLIAAAGLVFRVRTLPAPAVLGAPALAHALHLAAQDAGDDTDEPRVTPDQLAKYERVYEAMQRNHSLTVEQAAAQQGLTLAQFRDLENRIQRNDDLRTQVRSDLRKAAATGTPASGAPTPGASLPPQK